MPECMTEQELWKTIVSDPSNEGQHQHYADACVEHGYEKEAVERYRGMQKSYPVLADKFIKQLTTAAEFKCLSSLEEEEKAKEEKSIVGRLRGLIHSLLLTGLFSLAYGIFEKSTIQILIGAVLIAVYVSYISGRPTWTRRG